MHVCTSHSLGRFAALTSVNLFTGRDCQRRDEKGAVSNGEREKRMLDEEKG